MLTAAAAQKNTEQLTVSRERGRRGTERAGEEAKDNGKLTTVLKTGGKRRVQSADCGGDQGTRQSSDHTDYEVMNCG